jgi:hypothetical protein
MTMQHSALIKRLETCPTANHYTVRDPAPALGAGNSPIYLIGERILSGQTHLVVPLFNLPVSNQNDRCRPSHHSKFPRRDMVSRASKSPGKRGISILIGATPIRRILRLGQAVGFLPASLVSVAVRNGIYAGERKAHRPR